MSHDNSGRDPDWYLEEVTIDVLDKEEQYIFPCHRWLLGGQRDVELLPGTFAPCCLRNFTCSVHFERLNCRWCTSSFLTLAQCECLGKELLWAGNRAHNVLLLNVGTK